MDDTIADKATYRAADQTRLLRLSLSRYGLDDWFQSVHIINGWLTRGNFTHSIAPDAKQ